ncbi:dehydrodolichyl diphosphate synthase complex subunit [Trichophyton mentagrophytes]|nr:dehydrodolichyl diphosphate synthase complex subunit [Trichophyton mentagrophytes]
MPFAQLLQDQLSSRFVLNLLMSIVQQGPVPKHVAIIADGNRRWAKSHEINIKRGHQIGAMTMHNILDLFFDTGVECVTVYLFSIENFKRPKDQVDDLMDLSEIWIRWHLSPPPNKRKIRFQFLGRLELLPEKIRKLIKELVEKTADYDEGTFNVCFSYTSRDEMARAIEMTVRNHNNSPENGGNITAETIDNNMDTCNDPPLDVLIRTSGVNRLSDFLLWQCHRDTIIEVLDIHWPEFRYWHLFRAVLGWQRKKMATVDLYAGATEEPKYLWDLTSKSHFKWLMSVILLLVPAAWGYHMAFYPK